MNFVLLRKTVRPPSIYWLITPCDPKSAVRCFAVRGGVFVLCRTFQTHVLEGGVFLHNSPCLFKKFHK